jgi:hypothetical protein
MQIEPSIEILGVYKLWISEETYREQWEVTASDEDTKEHFDGLILIEAIAHNIDDQFDISRIGQQPSHSDDPNYFMVPYDEALLSSDGETLIQREMDCVHGTGSLRFAFYLHLYDPSKPLMTAYGPIDCPDVQPVPARLKELIPYNACS